MDFNSREKVPLLGKTQHLTSYDCAHVQCTISKTGSKQVKSFGEIPKSASQYQLLHGSTCKLLMLKEFPINYNFLHVMCAYVTPCPHASTVLQYQNPTRLKPATVYTSGSRSTNNNCYNTSHCTITVLLFVISHKGHQARYQNTNQATISTTSITCYSSSIKQLIQ